MESDQHGVWNPDQLVQEAVTGNGPEQDCQVKEAQPASCQACPLELDLPEGGGEGHANDVLGCREKTKTQSYKQSKEKSR